MNRSDAGALGILGGTFDPVHRAHLHLARAALTKLGLAGVLWIPAGRPALRQPPQATPTQRLDMVRIAVAPEPRFAVDAAEVETDSPSYTVPTLERLRRKHGARPLVLLLGADAFLGLTGWHRWRELFGLAHLAVAARPGAALDPTAMAPALAGEYRTRHGAPQALRATPAGAIATFEIEPVEPVDLSATMVRAALRGDHATAAALLPNGVLDYIARNHLYSV